MSSSAQRGLSLIEMVIFIVVLSAGVAGLAVIYNQVTRASVDPVVRKQLVAVASSLMEEIQLQPFTLCDPDDPNVFTAPTPACTIPEVQGTEGPPSPETRYAEPRFDNVSDYHGFQMLGSIRDVFNNPIPELNGYEARVTVVQDAGLGGIPADAALLITVAVRHPGTGLEVRLQGYRTRYAPNSP